MLSVGQKIKIMEHPKMVLYGIGILILESMLMGIWFYVMKPESDGALNTFSIVFLLLGINLVLGLLFYFLKNPYSLLFFANTIICPLIFYAIWIMWFTFYAQYPN